jgi:hypothetical protein
LGKYLYFIKGVKIENLVANFKLSSVYNYKFK